MAVPGVPLPPLNIATSSSAGANTGGFSIGGLNMTPNAQSLTSLLPVIVSIAAVGGAALLLAKKS
ncbi:MAG: hypothetical protein CMN80_00915 [Spongiibacter sp.]|uniref:hypothetical protein n=1 Tax=uncultured Spongiibacter sp. TaxID=870896 RepID=UPI000C09674B|nr:hypothetical protein [Spongiibacter sp.]|tara:strand:- start:373 stop:567 length:195 start_codon:yes stop_codon:yes gene_type:complete